MVKRNFFEKNREARSDFEKALKAAEKVNDGGYEEWVYYIRATMAYLDQNVSELEQMVVGMEPGSNRNIVLHMIFGLKTFGNVDYDRDYRNTDPSLDTPSS